MGQFGNKIKVTILLNSILFIRACAIMRKAKKREVLIVPVGKKRVVIAVSMLAVAICIGVIIGSVAGYVTKSAFVNTVSSGASISEAISQLVTSQPVSQQPVSSAADISEIPSSKPASSAVSRPSSAPSSSSSPSKVSSAPNMAVITKEMEAIQTMFPNFYVDPTEKIAHKAGDKVAYLTFDDGPSDLTPQVLKILADNDVKATFFVIGRSDEQSKKRMKEIIDQGHTIGMHTYTHNYKQIYASPTAFFSDLSKLSDLITDATGVKPQVIRFAGGSVNSYNKTIARPVANELTRRGYTYFDWNVSAGDAEKGATAQSIYQNTVNETLRFEKAVVLFHDASTKHDTVKELPRIIETLKKNGYRFDKLDSSVKPIIFKLPAQ